MPSKKLIDDLEVIFNRNRANAGLEPIYHCEGCGVKLKSPGRCVSCYMDWVSPLPAERAS